jgi:hypothetical protein
MSIPTPIPIPTSTRIPTRSDLPSWLYGSANVLKLITATMSIMETISITFVASAIRITSHFGTDSWTIVNGEVTQVEFGAITEVASYTLLESF